MSHKCRLIADLYENGYLGKLELTLTGVFYANGIRDTGSPVPALHVTEVNWIADYQGRVGNDMRRGAGR